MWDYLKSSESTKHFLIIVGCLILFWAIWKGQANYHIFITDLKNIIRSVTCK